MAEGTLSPQSAASKAISVYMQLLLMSYTFVVESRLRKIAEATEDREKLKNIIDTARALKIMYVVRPQLQTIARAITALSMPDPHMTGWAFRAMAQEPAIRRR
jgi:predicted Ser/Thr protein kinase